LGENLFQRPNLLAPAIFTFLWPVQYPGFFTDARRVSHDAGVAKSAPDGGPDECKTGLSVTPIYSPFGSSWVSSVAASRGGGWPLN